MFSKSVHNWKKGAYEFLALYLADFEVLKFLELELAFDS